MQRKAAQVQRVQARTPDTAGTLAADIAAVHTQAAAADKAAATVPAARGCSFQVQAQ